MSFFVRVQYIKQTVFFIALQSQTKAGHIDDWQDHINTQLSSTEGVDALSDHRGLVENRWTALRSFATEEADNSVLSPDSKQLKSDVFLKEGALSDTSLKSYKKKLTSYVQGLSNASDRLNSIHREEVGYLALIESFLK